MLLYFNFNKKEYIFHVISIVKFSPYIKAERQTLYFCKNEIAYTYQFYIQSYKCREKCESQKIKKTVLQKAKDYIFVELSSLTAKVNNTLIILASSLGYYTSNESKREREKKRKLMSPYGFN